MKNVVALNDGLIKTLANIVKSSPQSVKPQVGMLYFVWHCMARDPARNKVIEQAHKDGIWGNIPDFHWRNTPAITGNISDYCTSNKSLVEKHVTLLEEAGVDYVVVDFTNQCVLNGSHPNCVAADESMISSFRNLLEVSASRGGKLKIIPWVPFQGDLYLHLMGMMSQYSMTNFMLQDKPLIIASWDKSRGQNIVDIAIADVKARGFSVRKMWGLHKGSYGSDVWSFMEVCHSGFRQSEGKTKCNQATHPEMSSVSLAYQETLITEFNTSVPKFSGKTFLKQFETALESKSPMILINGWNEWIAQRFCLRDGQLTHLCYVGTNTIGDHFPNGRPVFVDLYSREYSRDIEPDTLSDEYYKLLKKTLLTIKEQFTQAPPPQVIHGVCGDSHNKTFSSTPNSNLCLKGEASSVTSTASEYLWKCAGVNGGSILDCKASKATTTPTNPATTIGEVRGAIDAVELDNGVTIIRGWACSKGYEGAIPVHVYAGGPAGSGSLILGASADSAREAAVGSACETTSSKHGFMIQLTPSQKAMASGKKIYLHGISVDSKFPNSLIGNSGKMTAP